MRLCQALIHCMHERVEHLLSFYRKLRCSRHPVTRLEPSILFVTVECTTEKALEFGPLQLLQAGGYKAFGDVVERVSHDSPRAARARPLSARRGSRPMPASSAGAP